MKIATSAYPISWLDSWDDYVQKLSSWVKDARDHGAQLLVFPEYAAMELASLDGPESAGDRVASMKSVASYFSDFTKLHQQLAKHYGVYILSGSAPIQDQGALVNRCGLFTPDGSVGWQDKQIMTRFERDDWKVSGGDGLQVFETALGRIGILICYDSEFPLLGRALSKVDVLLVPSCTEALSGYWRVRIGSMARALENQCAVVMSSLLSKDDRFYGVDEATGTGGVFCPPDKGFPESGVLALGTIGDAGWTYATIDTAQIAEVRKDGAVLNRKHWSEQIPRAMTPPSLKLT